MSNLVTVTVFKDGKEIEIFNENKSFYSGQGEKYLMDKADDFAYKYILQGQRRLWGKCKIEKHGRTWNTDKIIYQIFSERLLVNAFINS